MNSEIGDLIDAHGFFLDETGGNCTALTRIFDDFDGHPFNETEIMLTAKGTHNAPEKIEQPVTVTINDGDGILFAKDCDNVIEGMLTGFSNWASMFATSSEEVEMKANA